MKGRLISFETMYIFMAMKALEMVEMARQKNEQNIKTKSSKVNSF